MEGRSLKVLSRQSRIDVRIEFFNRTALWAPSVVMLHKDILRRRPSKLNLYRGKETKILCLLFLINSISLWSAWNYILTHPTGFHSVRACCKGVSELLVCKLELFSPLLCSKGGFQFYSVILQRRQCWDGRSSSASKLRKRWNYGKMFRWKQVAEKDSGIMNLIWHPDCSYWGVKSPSTWNGTLATFPVRWCRWVSAISSVPPDKVWDIAVKPSPLFQLARITVLIDKTIFAESWARPACRKCEKGNRFPPMMFYKTGYQFPFQ